MPDYMALGLDKLLSLSVHLCSEAYSSHFVYLSVSVCYHANRNIFHLHAQSKIPIAKIQE